MELITITIFIIFTTILFLQLRTIHRNRNKLAPGPWNLPILGGIHHFMNHDRTLPHVTLRNLSKIHGPLMHLKAGKLNFIVASSPEAAKAIMKTHEVAFATRPLLKGFRILTYGGKNIANSPYGNYWRQLRKICTLKFLSEKRVASFSSIRQQELLHLVRSLSSSACSSFSNDVMINVSEKIKSCINNITVGASVGSRLVKGEQQKMFLNALDEAVDALTGLSNLDDLFPSFSWLLGLFYGYKAHAQVRFQTLDSIIDCILQDHKQKMAMTSRGGEEEMEVLIDVLLKLQSDDALEFKLTDDCIKAVVMDMVGAGSETSSTAILWAMSELMRNPAAMKKVQKEIREIFKEEPAITEARIREAEYLQSVIKETLRLHTPAPVLPRECIETCNVLGYEIPQGTIAVVNVWAIGRDPEYWENAEQFKPERFVGSAVDFKGNSFEFLPFGSGRRMCPGILFGMVNVELVLANLLYYFDWELPGGVQHDELDMSELFGITCRRKSDLCLSVKVAIPVPE